MITLATITSGTRPEETREEILALFEKLNLRPWIGIYKTRGYKKIQRACDLSYRLLAPWYIMKNRDIALFRVVKLIESISADLDISNNHPAHAKAHMRDYVRIAARIIKEVKKTEPTEEE